MEPTVPIQPAIHDFNVGGTKFALTPKVLSIFLIAVILGLGTGYFLSKNKVNTVFVGKGTNLSNVSKGSSVGSSDTTTFKDQAEGVLKKGGVDGEGAYHLIRPGGDSQNVYLTSSIVDLGTFVDRKIKVWGQTQKAQKAGWLMDVGRVEVLE